ncbi:MAG: hypothetical protein JJU13_10315 [Balneolaceae bacterium]|nr:hypothetical protein [Balneolaceae bacterium]
MRRNVAIHEAAHFLAFYDCGFNPKCISIIADAESGRLGSVTFGDSWNSFLDVDRAVGMVFCALIGVLAENKKAGSDVYDVKYSDWFFVADTLSGFHRRDAQRIMDRANTKAETWLKENWNRVETLAREVSKKREMTLNEVKTNIPWVLTT